MTIDEDEAREFLGMAYEEAIKSLDPSTQNGAILMGEGGGWGVAGHNEFPAGVLDKPERWERPLKYAYIEHAERNAIYMAARWGYGTAGTTLYCPWFACADCGRAIIQAGVAEVVGHKYMFDETPERWKDSIADAHAMLEEAGVVMTILDGPVAGPSIRFNGKLWNPNWER